MDTIKRDDLAKPEVRKPLEDVVFDSMSINRDGRVTVNWIVIDEDGNIGRKGQAQAKMQDIEGLHDDLPLLPERAVDRLLVFIKSMMMRGENLL